MGQDRRGSLSLEAAIIMPLVMAFVALLLTINIKVYKYVYKYEDASREVYVDYTNTHRQISAIFDAGGNIYEILFG